MKRFRELRESVYSPNGINVPDASDGLDATGIYAIEQPEVLARLNAVVQAAFAVPCNDIKRKMVELRTKLNIAGIDLDLTDFIPAEGEQKVPLNRFGGRSGWDMEKGAVTSDDGIEPFTGYKMCLYLTITLDNYSFYRIEGYIAPSIEEEVPELGEAKDEFKPHMMYDPKTGKGYKAEKEADHLRMKKMGYTHEKPEVKEEYEEWYEAMRTVMVRTESTNPEYDENMSAMNIGEAVKVNKKDGPFTVVALKGKKVVGQFKGADHKELSDVVKMMKAENKGAKISVEAKGGKVVHTESVELDEAKVSKTYKVDADKQASIVGTLQRPEFKRKTRYDVPTKGSTVKVEFDNDRVRKEFEKKVGIKESVELEEKATRTAVDKEFNRVTRSGKMDTLRATRHVETKFKIKNVKVQKDKNGKSHVISFDESVELSEDRESAMELKIYIENDAQLYKSQMLSIFKNLMAKRARGQYQSKLASKLFMYLVDNGAKKYVKEHDAPGAKWNKVFDKATRQQVADMLTRDFEMEAESGAYDNFIPKKYQTK